MSDLFWLTDEQIERMRPFFPKSHGRPRVDDRRVLSGIVFVDRNGLRWRDAPSDYGPHKTLYNRWKRWGEAGVFTRMMEGLAATGAEPNDRCNVPEGAPHGIQPAGKKGAWPPDRPHQRRHEHQAPCRCRRERAPLELLHDCRTGQRLHRRGSAPRRYAQAAVAAGRPRIRRRLVQRRSPGQGHPALHPGSAIPQRTGQV